MDIKDLHPKLIWVSENEAHLKSEDFENHDEYVEAADMISKHMEAAESIDRTEMVVLGARKYIYEHETMIFKRI